MNDGDMSLLAKWNWARTGVYCTFQEGDEVSGGESFFTLPPISPNVLSKKDEAVLRLIGKEKAAGFPTLIYYIQMDRRPIEQRLIKLASEYGMKVVPMYSTTKSREAFIRKAMEEGADAILCHPGLVREGIDLLMFRQIIWYGVTDDAILVNQADARIDRIGKIYPTDVYFLGYNETVESERWVNTAKKIQAMSAVHGNVNSGLAALLGDESLITVIQDKLISYDKQESDLTLDDLPKLVKFEPKVAGQIRSYVNIQPAMSWYEWRKLNVPEEKPKPKPRKEKVKVPQLLLF